MQAILKPLLLLLWLQTPSWQNQDETRPELSDAGRVWPKLKLKLGRKLSARALVELKPNLAQVGRTWLDRIRRRHGELVAGGRWRPAILGAMPGPADAGGCRAHPGVALRATLARLLALGGRPLWAGAAGCGCGASTWCSSAGPGRSARAHLDRGPSAPQRRPCTTTGRFPERVMSAGVPQKPRPSASMLQARAALFPLRSRWRQDATALTLPRYGAAG